MTVPTRRPSLLVFDVDGTLLDHDGELSDDRAEALAAISAVVPTIFATGKTWPSVAALAERFGLEGPHLTCNGAAAVLLDGTVEVLEDLPRPLVDDLVDELTRRGVATSTYLSDGGSVTPRDDERFAHIERVSETRPAVAPIPDDARVLKVLAVLREDEEADLRSLHADEARIQRTGGWFLEWNAPGASKGNGLRMLAARHSIDLADAFAVGDSENDVSMFEAAGVGIAVASASRAAVDGADVQLEQDIADWLADLVRQADAGASGRRQS